MGNAPSSAAPPVQTRLTKPRTNTNSPHACSKPDTTSPTSSPSKAASPGPTDDADVQSPLQERGEPQELLRSFSSHHSARSYESAQPFPQELSPAQEYSTDTIGTDPADVPSRSGSILAQVANLKNSSTTTVDTLNVKRNSTVRDSTDISDMDVNAAIALLQELKKKASPEDLVALHKALLPNTDFDPQSTPVLEEKRSVISSLIRRKSLLPAGIATRSAPSQENLKKGTPLPIKSRRPQSERPLTLSGSNADKDHKNNLAALDLAEESQNIYDARAATPIDMDYQIGSYKQGTLRITNGAASPDPSVILRIAERASSPDLKSADGYFTADEDCSSNDTFDGPHLEGLSVRDKILSTSKAARQGNSPRSARMRAQSCDGRPKPPAPLRIKTSIEEYDAESESADARQRSRVRPRHRASDIAQDYMSECDLSPSPYNRKISGGHFVHRLSTVPSMSDISPVEKVGSPEEALRKLNGTDQPLDICPPLGSHSCASTLEHVLRPTPSQLRPILAPTKSDSGYSSEASFQIKQDRSSVGAASLEVTPEKTSTTSLPSTVSVQSPSAEYEAFLPLPMKQRPLQRNSMPVYGTVPQGSTTSFVPTGSTQSLPVQDISTDVPGQNAKRQQKGRSVSGQQTRAPLTVQSATNVRSNALPNVPAEVSVNFSRRLTTAPKMAALDRTYVSVDDVSQENTAQSAKERKSGFSSPSGGVDSSAAKATRGRSQSKVSQPEQPSDDSSPLQKKRSIFRLRGRSKSRSKSVSQADLSVFRPDAPPVPTISDLGSVAQSLGGSPYDLATKQSKVAASQGARPISHPHQISTQLNNPSEESIVTPDMIERATAQHARATSRGRTDRTSRNASPSKGMDERASTEHSRTRSRGRTEEASRRASRSRSRSKSLPRYYAKSNDAAEQHPPTPKLPADPAQTPTPATPRMGRSRNTYTEGLPQLPGSRERTASEAPRRAPQERRERAKSVSPRVGRHPLPTEESPAMKLRASPQQLSGESVNAQISSGEMTEGAVESPSHDSMHPGWPGWETQARRWREHRKSLSESLPKLSTSSTHIVAQYKQSPKVTTPQSPAIFVSRYITPTGAELAAQAAEATGTTPAPVTEETEDEDDHIDPYYTLCESNRTDLRPAKSDVPRTDSAISTATFRSAVSYASNATARNPADVQDTNSSSEMNQGYRAYRQSDALTLTALTSPRLPNNNSSFSLPPKSSRPLSQSRIVAPTPSPDSLFDRFSGGLDYGWERGAGFAGSAGTRGNESKAQRKSIVLAENFGVDLSDVPVFLRKV
ncbi:hypothetical protein H2203_003955 [Taxawa tesnikishii (nom. ined.)]|nr:hypothetical protein H2203_003955 [Dothideales sp. JES 119]